MVFFLLLPLWFLCLAAGVVLCCFKNIRFLSSYLFLFHGRNCRRACALNPFAVGCSANAEQHGLMGQVGCHRILPFRHWTGRCDWRSGWLQRCPQVEPIAPLAVIAFRNGRGFSAPAKVVACVSGRQAIPQQNARRE